MRTRTLALTLLMTTVATVLTIVSMNASAQQQGAPQQPGNEQVIVPQVDRREVKLPRMPSNDIEVGAFVGTYSTQNFGAHAVAGLRLGYHITEDFFVEGVYGQTRVNDDAFRQILPGGVFAQGTETIKYYNVSGGYNVLPGEVFFGRNWAKASALYVIAGVGSTHFNQQRRQTFNFGLGLRVFPSDRWAVQVDMRDHIFSLDLLGQRQSTNNLELTGGITFFF
jgi:outer membrane beta-barrel protein